MVVDPTALNTPWISLKAQFDRALKVLQLSPDPSDLPFDPVCPTGTPYFDLPAATARYTNEKNMGKTPGSFANLSYLFDKNAELQQVPWPKLMVLTQTVRVSVLSGWSCNVADYQSRNTEPGCDAWPISLNFRTEDCLPRLMCG